jgi:hypothetical protein
LEPVFIAKYDFRDAYFKRELRTALKAMESLIGWTVEWEGDNVKVTRSATGHKCGRKDTILLALDRNVRVLRSLEMSVYSTESVRRKSSACAGSEPSRRDG